jgi:hypothetical protein
MLFAVVETLPFSSLLAYTSKASSCRIEKIKTTRVDREVATLPKLAEEGGRG